MIGIQYIATLYNRLSAHADQVFIEGQLATFPRSSKQIVKFLAGYLTHRYQPWYVDFYDVESAPSHIVSERPVDFDVYSWVEMHKRPKLDSIGTSTNRLVEIYINTAISSNGDPVTNTCWRRFCIVKEACQALIFEDFKKYEQPYPYSQSFSQIDSLLTKINTEPYSVWDFENQSYDPSNYVENLAEIMAIGLLVKFDNLFDLQEQLAKNFEGDLTKVDLYEMANQFKVPQRYLELMLTWTGLGELVALIEAEQLQNA